MYALLHFVSTAQTPKTSAPEAKKETSVAKSEVKSELLFAVQKQTKHVCKNNTAAKTPEQKAECAKAGAHEAKVEKAEVKLLLQKLKLLQQWSKNIF